MAWRELLGLALVTAGLVLTPVAWITSRILWLVAFALMVAGAYLFFSARVLRRMERDRREGTAGSADVGRPMPTDIHNYTGWRSGGRSETMDNTGGDADGD